MPLLTSLKESLKAQAQKSLFPSDLTECQPLWLITQVWTDAEVRRLGMHKPDRETSGMTTQDLATGFAMNVTGFLRQEWDVGWGGDIFC